MIMKSPQREGWQDKETNKQQTNEIKNILSYNKNYQHLVECKNKSMSVCVIVPFSKCVSV